MQDRAAGHVGEADIAELDLSLERRAGNGRGPVRPGRRGVQQSEITLRASHREGRFGELRADDRDRREEKIGQKEERHEVAKPRARAGECGPAADANQRGHETLGVEFEQRQVERRQARGLDDVVRQALDQAGEDTSVRVLPGEALRHANTLDGLGERRGHPGEGLLLHA